MRRNRSAVGSTRSEVVSASGRTGLGAIVQRLVISRGFVLLAVLVVYGDSLQGPFVDDDLPSIVDNATIRRWYRLDRVLAPPVEAQTVAGRPMLNLTFAVNYVLGGTKVFGYHAVNVLIHILNAWLLFTMIERTMRQPAVGERLRSSARLIAWAAALLWAVHPLLTESVTYTVQRAESLAATAMLLAWYGLARGAESETGRRWYLLAVGACLVGVGVNAAVVVAPLMLLVYDRTFLSDSWTAVWQRRRGFYAALCASWVVASGLAYTTGEVARQAELPSPSPTEYAWSQPAVVLHYVRLALWPVSLCFDYAWPLPAARLAELPAVLVVAIALAITAWGAVRGRAWAFCGAAFFLLLAPSSSFVPHGQLAAEHRMYLPLAALVAGVAVAVMVVGERISSQGVREHQAFNRCAIGAFLVALVLLARGTVDRNSVYADGRALWQDTVEKAPVNPLAWKNLGDALVKAKQAEEATAAQFAATNRIAEARAAIDRAGQRADEAQAAFDRALELKPDYAPALVGRGLLLAGQGRTEQALKNFELAVKFAPRSTVARVYQGNELIRQNRLTEGALAFRRALEIDPEMVPARLALGNVLAQQQKIAEAITEFERCLEADPENATVMNNLALVFTAVGRFDEAIPLFRRAVRIDPSYTTARDNLERTLEMKEQRRRAN